MEWLSRRQIAASLAVMLVAAALAAAASVVYLPAVLRQALALGADQSLFFVIITGFLLAVGLAAWLLGCRLCAIIQKDQYVWGRTWFLIAVFLAVVGANSAVVYGPQLFGDGDQARLDHLTEAAQNQLSGDVTAYQNDLKAMGYPGFLQPPSLGAPRGLERSREKLNQARAITGRYRAHGEQLLADTRRTIAALPIAEVSKIEALANFDARNQRTAADRARCWEIQDAMLGEYLRLVDDLAKAKSHWSASGRMLLFQRQEDLDRFNQHLKTTAALASEAAKAQLHLARANQPLQS